MVIARSIKTDIVKSNDDLVEIVTSSIYLDMKNNDYELNDKDVIGLTESIVSISNNNYCHIDDIVADINSKYQGDTLGVVFPILSRNRFSVILKALARAKKEIVLLLSYPNDEVGNSIMDTKTLSRLDMNKDQDILTEEDYYKHFSDFVHPWTKINMVDYYKEVIELEGSTAKFIFSNNALDILKYTSNVLVSDIHSRDETKALFDNINNATVYKLDNILSESINGSGYNKDYGLLGSNLATKETLKLFPNSDLELLERIQNKIYQDTNKKVEVLVYGDGAFKDPISKIWELADPVVSPSYTKGLEGSPNEVKLKYLAENEYRHLKGEELAEAIRKHKENASLDSKLGTTPRRYVDLLGSLMDLMSGSGDRSTPVVLVQNYFK